MEHSVRRAALVVLVAWAVVLPVAAPCQEPSEQPVIGDNQWPRIIELENAVVTLYQPQLDSWGDGRVEARAAVSVASPPGAEPVFGAVWISGRYEVDRDARTVTLLDITVPKVQFQEATEEQKKKLAAILEEEFPKMDLVFDLDRVIPYLELVEAQIREAQVRNDPPRILIRHEPAVLILIDGKVRLEKVENAPFERVVNTPYVMVNYDGDFWLATDKDWYSAGDVDGTWALRKSLPGPLRELDRQLKEQQESEDREIGEAGGEDVPEQKLDPRVPAIVVSHEPAELVFIDGKPNLEALGETGLSEVTNTDSDLLYHQASRHWYVLLSGRWFRSTDLDAGPWSFVPSDELPEGFAGIPADSDVGYLRASVSGTEEAREAVLDQVVPNTAAVKRDAPPPEVEYDGAPKFEPIAKTAMKYAVNTESSVILSQGKYYCCDQGIWFVADTATGPWKVAATVPAELASIPPSSPVYNTTYVKIYETTPEVVHVGYTPGYMGSYVHHGCVVYGTGYHYPSWWGPHHYYPRPFTYGFHVRWNPWYGWSFGFSFGFGPFRFTMGHGPWGWGGWFGPGFFRPYPPFARAGWRAGYRHGYRQGYWHGRLDGRRPGTMPYRRGNIYRNPANRARIAQRPTTRDVRRPRPAGDRANNVYTDRNGNVYRRNQDGTWDRRDRGSWQKTTRPAVTGRPTTPSGRPGGGVTRPSTSPATRPATKPSTRPATRPSTRPATPSRTPRSLESDHQARQRGTQRIQSRPPTRSYSSGSSSRGASRAPGGGGIRRR